MNEFEELRKAFDRLKWEVLDALHIEKICSWLQEKLDRIKFL